MGINMGQHLAGHVASLSRDLVLEHRGDCGIHGLVAVLLPEPIEHVKSRRSERSTGTPKALEIVWGTSSIDLVLLPEVPAKLGGIVQPQGPAHLLASRILEERDRLHHVARHEQPQFPLRQGPQQLGVTM